MNKRKPLFFPPRWLNCPSVGNLLVDLFIPFKTPLDDKYRDMMPPEYIFDPESVFEFVKPYQLGIVFDLTKSSRFYHRREIEDHGCSYVKIICQGHEECPSEDQVKLFVGAVNSFVSRNQENGKKIGVHCTHGFNRTGFMIVSYLVSECSYSLEVALKLFADARPPGIYKEDYLKELYRRYDDPDDCPPPPQLPDWCNEEEGKSTVLGKRSRPAEGSKQDNLGYDYDDEEEEEKEGEATQGMDDGAVVASSITASQRFPPPPRGEPKLMEGVVGVKTLDQASYEAHHVRTVVDYLIRLGGAFAATTEASSAVAATTATPAYRFEPPEPPLTSLSLDIRREPLTLPLNCDRNLRFRGSQPVSMTRRNARFVVDSPYLVTYKSDGTRYLLLIHGPGRVYLIDRGNFVYKVDCLHFPTSRWCKSAVESLEVGVRPSDFMMEAGGHLVNTLLDGELVAFDNTPERPFKFLVYDAVVIQGYACGLKPFFNRLEYIENFVLRPRNEAGHKGLVDFRVQAFSVRKKPFFPLAKTLELINMRREDLQHETDGLIFQPAGPNDVYVLNTCKETLKWKPPELNTIDFRCRIHLRKAVGEPAQRVGELFLGGATAPAAQLARVNARDQHLDGKIVECCVDPAVNGWRVLRVRTDKTEPNHVSVGQLVMESIQFPVEARHLVHMVTSWMHACEQHHRQGQEEGRCRQQRQQNPDGGRADDRSEVQTDHH